MFPIGSGHKLHNRRVENCLLLGIDLRARDRELTAITTIVGKYGASKVLFTHMKSLGITPEIFHFPEDVQLFPNPTHCLKLYQHPIEQEPTTIGLIIYKHSTHTKFQHPACGSSEEKLSNPGITQGHLGLTPSPRSLD